MDFINDVTLKDSKLVFKTVDSKCLQEITKNAIEFDDSAKLKASFDGIEIGSEIKLGNEHSNDYANIAITSNSCGVSQLAIYVGSEICGKLSIGGRCSNFTTQNLAINTCYFDINATALDVAGRAQFGGNVNFCGDVYAHSDLTADKTLFAKENVLFTGSKCGTSKFVSDIPATFNDKAIFNNGICTKTITSIAGTPIFDTTDGKGFNFKGLYTLNGFGTTNKPFFKQESATNNWIDVTTLKEGGTALENKYALKTDIPADVDLSNYAQKATTLAGYGITDAYTKSEIDLKDTAFLTKESSGIQTVSSDLALTGYVLIDNLAIDELNIESLSAKSMVTLGGGLTVTGGITVDDEEVATKSDISGFITKDVSNLTYYETKTVAEGKYALKTSLSSYALKTDISNVYKYVGSVNNVSELPSNLTEADSGKVYNIVNESTSGDLSVSAGDNVAWTGSSWDKLGGSVDLSNYAQKATTLAGYGITDSYTKSEIDLKESAFLTKESSGIQTVSSDLALTGYVLIDNLAIDELNIESLTASSKVTLDGGLDVVGGLAADGGDFTGSIHIESRAKSTNESDFYTNERYISIDGLADPTIGGTTEHVKIYSTMHKAGVVELSDWSTKTVYSPGSIRVISSNGVPGSPAGTLYFPNIGNSGSDVIATASSVESKADKATTLAGYGITDAYTKTEVNDLVGTKADASTVYTKSEIDLQNVEFLKKESSGIQTISSDLALTGYVLIDNLAIDELNIESLTATSKVTLSGGLDVTGGITVDGKEVATKDDIPDSSDVKTPIFKYFQNPVVPASCTLFAIAINAEFENMPMMQLVRNSDNTIVSADISWVLNNSNKHDIMVGIDHSSEISANTYTLQAFGY